MILLAMRLTIAGTVHADTTWPSSGLVVDGFQLWDYEGDLELEFHEEGPAVAAPSATYHAGQSVILEVNDGSGWVTVFFGVIDNVSSPPTGDEGFSFAYRCRGPKYLADQLWITSSAFTGTMLFNDTPTDAASIPANNGKTVGAIIAAVLTQHSTALTALGITTDTTTADQLGSSGLTDLQIVPPDPVYISGRVWASIKSLLQQYARNVADLIGPDGLVRFVDTTAGASVTLTEGTDLFDPLRLGYDVTDTATRFVVRGGGDVRPFYCLLSETYVDSMSATQHMVKPAWTPTQQANWNEQNYLEPTGATDAGTVVSISSPTTVVLNSADPTQTVAANYWSDRQAWLHVYNSAMGGGGGITFSEAVPVTANTSEAAAGNFTVTLAIPLQNSGVGAYNTYKLLGQAPPLSGTGLIDVWRLYQVNDPGALVADHLVKAFPQPVAFEGYYGDSTQGTGVPQAQIVEPFGVTLPPIPFDIVPGAGQIRFARPIVEAFNSLENLNKGGAAVVPPHDIVFLFAYARGPLESVYPPDISGVPQYAGTAYTLFGLERTAYLDFDNWTYAVNQPLYDALAQMHHKAICDVPFNGNVPVRGAMSSVFWPFTAGSPGTWGFLLDLAGNGYTTGQESIAVPIRGVKVRCEPQARGGVLYWTDLRVSARRNPATGDRVYDHPTRFDQLVFKMPEGGLPFFGAPIIPTGVADPSRLGVSSIPGGVADPSQLVSSSIPGGIASPADLLPPGAV